MTSTHPPPLLRYLLAFEVATNLLSAIPMILTPTKWLTSVLTPHPHPLDTAITHPAAVPASPSPAAIQLAQYLGALILTLTVPILYAVPDAPAGPASDAVARAARAEKGRFRRKLYMSLAAGEALLVLIFGAQLVGQPSAAGTPGALKPGALVFMMVALANLAALRMWAMLTRPGWFGEEVFGGTAGPARKKKKAT